MRGGFTSGSIQQLLAVLVRFENEVELSVEVTGGIYPVAQRSAASPDEPPAHTKCGVVRQTGLEPVTRSLGTAP